MRTLIKILAVLLICFVPQSGCKVIKKTFSRKTSQTETKRTVDSTAVHRFDSMSRLNTGSIETLDELMRKHQAAIREQENNINYKKETVLKPVIVPGKTYEFTANWVLDTAATGRGVITYFAADQPDLSASISRDSAGQMKVKIQTKDKVIDMPVESVTFSSHQALKTDSSLAQEELREAMRKDSANQAYNKSEYDSGHVVADNHQKSSEKTVQKETKRIDSRSVWLLVGGIVVFALLIVAWKFGWIGKVLNNSKHKS